MSLLDYQNPDITYGRDAEWYLIDWSDKLTIVVIQIKDKYLALRVFATRRNWSQVMSQTYFTWDCTHPYPKDTKFKKKSDTCYYHPSHEDMPPLPGQRCHNCGGLRAEIIPTVTNIRMDNETHT